MVSLSKNESVQSLLARFRHAGAIDTVVPSPAPTTLMVATAGQPSPSTQGREVVRYDASNQPQTRSQQQRLAAAEDGDLKERLNLITIEAAEAGLARRYCKHHPDRSILEYLRQPGEGVAPHEAVAVALEDIVDETAETAAGLAEVFRYMQVHGMWKTHPDRTIRSAEDFVTHLDHAGFIRVGFTFATTAQTAKRTCLRRIGAQWGTEWYRELPPDMFDKRGPEGLSKNVLARIATTAEGGRSLQAAIEEWGRAIERRNDMGNRRRLGIQGKVTPLLTLADVSIPGRSGRGASSIDHTSSHAPKEERLRVELIPRRAPTQPSATVPKYTETAQSKTPRKRKRAPDIVQEKDGEDGVDLDRWKKSTDGQWLTKRSGNQLIRKRVEEVEETENGSATSDREDGEESAPPRSRTRASPILISSGARADSSPPSTPVRSPHTSNSQNCAGPVFLKVLREAIKSFSELEDPDYIETRVCDCCRDSVTATVHSILHEARTNERMLGAISKHFFGTQKVPPRQEQLELPKRHMRWDTLFVADDSQSQDSE